MKDSPALNKFLAFGVLCAIGCVWIRPDGVFTQILATYWMLVLAAIYWKRSEE